MLTSLGKHKGKIKKLTVKLADFFSEEAGSAEADGLIVLVELAKGHSQAVVGK